MPKPPTKLPEQDNTQPITSESATEIIEPPDFYVKSEKRKPKLDRRESAFYLPLWSLVLMLLVVFGIAGGLIILVIALGGPKNVSGGEPVIIVLTAAPFETPSVPQMTRVAPTLAPLSNAANPAATVALSGPTLAPTLTFTPTQATIAVGSQVIVVGAGGVNVRAAPGRENAVLFSANRNERFMVIDGPREEGDLTWWEIRDPLDTSRTGWAAEGDNSQDLLQVYVP
jgi:Bacterial SH3 domain